MQSFLFLAAWASGFAAWHASDLTVPWAKFQSEAWAGASLVLLLFAKHCLLTGRPQPYRRFNALDFCLLIIPLLAGMHFVTTPSVYLGDVALITLYAIGAFLAMQLGYSLAMSPARDHFIQALCLLLSTSAIFSVAEALYQWLMLDGLGYWILPIPTTARPSGNFAQANRMAMHAATGLAALLWLYRIKAIRAAGLTIGASFICLGIALTQSRAGVLSASLILLLAALWQRRERRAFALHILLLLGSACLFWKLPFFSEFLDLGSIRSDRLALGSRGTLVGGFIHAVGQYPWWGYGPGQIVHAQFFLASEGLPAKVSFWSHHAILDMALMFGIPFALLSLSAGLIFLRDCLRNLNAESCKFALLALIPFFVALNTEFPHTYLNSLLPYALIMGIAFTGSADAMPRAHPVSAAFQSGAAMIFMGLGCLVVSDYYKFETAFQIARFEALRAGSVPQGYKYPKSIVLDNIENLTWAVRQGSADKMTSEEIAEYLRVARRYPYETALRRYAFFMSSTHDAKELNAALISIGGFYGPLARQATEIAIARKKSQSDQR